MSTVRDLVLALPEEELREFVLGQRWYGSKSDEVASVQSWYDDPAPVLVRQGRGDLSRLGLQLD